MPTLFHVRLKSSTLDNLYGRLSSDSWAFCYRFVWANCLCIL